MLKIISLSKQYWYLVALFVVGLVFIVKKKLKTDKGEDEKDVIVNEVLEVQRIKDVVAKGHYKTLALQLAENMGTAYDWFDPRRWTENDDKIFELLQGITPKDFKIVSELYRKVYAKGSNLSEDLAKHLDSKLYALLTVK